MRPNLITRLKEEWNNLDPVDPLRGLIADAIDALAEESSGTEQPSNHYDDVRESMRQAFEQPAQQHEPVVTRFPMKLTCTKCGAVDEGFLDVESEAPPASKPLTDEQIQAIAFEAVKDNWDWLKFARAIEAKLREKNT